MKVKCPNCSSVGRVPADRISATGANIRCPSCAHVFFVGGPDHINVVSEADPGRSTLPTMSQTQSLPLPDPSQFRRSVASAEHAAVEQAPDDLASGTPQEANSSALPLDSDSRAEWGGQPANHTRQGVGGTEPQATDPASASSSFGEELNLDELLSDTERPAHSSEQAAAQPSAEPAPDRPSADNSATSAPAAADEGYDSAVRSALSSLIGPAAASPGAAPDTEAAETRSPSGAVRTVTSFKIRAQSGIIYDFHDFPAVRKWLATRASFDDLEVSTDAGNSYTHVADHPELQDVKPTALRARTGSLPAISDVRPPQSVGAGPAARSTGSVAAVPSPRAVTGSVRAVPDDAPLAGRNPRTSRTTSTGDKDKSPAKKDGTIPRARAIAYMVLISAAILAAVVYFMPEPDPIPNTPAGQHLRWVMGVINNGSSRLTMDDVAGHMTSDAFQQAGPAIRERLIAMDSWKDTFTILAIREPTPQTYIVVELTTETGNLGYLAIGTEPSAPYKVNLFLAGSGNPPANLLRPPQ